MAMIKDARSQTVPRAGAGGAEFPRRSCMDMWEPVEVALNEALRRVEELGCDPVLTDMVNDIQQLKDKVADFLEGKIGTP